MDSLWYKQCRCIALYNFDDRYDGLAPISYNPAYGTNNLKISNGPRPKIYSDIHNHYYNDNDIWTRNLSNEKTDPQKTKTTIKIISWNIHGLNEEKLSPCIVGGFLKKFDIILLTETWSTAEKSYGLDGFQYYNFYRGYKHSRARRGAGGQGVFYTERNK